MDRNHFWGPKAGDGKHLCLAPRIPFTARKHVPNGDEGTTLPSPHLALALAVAEGPSSQQRPSLNRALTQLWDSRSVQARERDCLPSSDSHAE